MRNTIGWAVGLFAAAGLVSGACTSFGDDNGVGPDAGAATDANGIEGGPGTLDGTLPAQQLNVKLDPEKATVARKGSTLVKVAIAVGGTSATVRLEAPQGSGLTAAPQVANGSGAAVLEIKASDKAVTKIDQKVRVVVEGIDGVSRGEASLDLEVRGAPGELDEGFGVGGFARLDLTGEGVPTTHGVLLESGAMLIGSTDESGAFLVKFDSSGQRDSAFGAGGKCRFFGADSDRSNRIQAMTTLTYGSYAAVSATGGTETSLYSLTPTCGTPLRPFASIPTTRLLGVNQLAQRGTSVMALGPGQSDNWAIESFVGASNQLDSAWGNGGRIVAPASSGTPIQFIEGSTEDRLFVASTGWIRQTLAKNGSLATASAPQPGGLIGFGNLAGEVVPIFSTYVSETSYVTFDFANGRKAIALRRNETPFLGSGTRTNREGFLVVAVRDDSEVTSMRTSKTGDLDKSFGIDGLASVHLNPLPAYASPVNIVEFGRFAYVVSNSYGIGLNQAVAYRFWL